MLNYLPVCVCVADDIIIHGKTLDEHDKNLRIFFQRCREKNIQLNKEKFVFRSDTISFMGHTIGKDGLTTDPEKVKAISEYPAPTSIDELRRFLGMINYLARFLPNVTDVLYPLHNLLKKDIQWQWTNSQEMAFKKVKDMLIKSPVLAFYSPDKELILENDASEYGLGSALLQEGRPIAFASRALSTSEKNYAQIEKEMLAIVYGLQKFDHFTFGRQVKIVTDHKPLVAIMSKSLSSAPKRLQSMLLQIQRYSCTIEYRPGKDLPLADALSRAPVSEPENTKKVVVNNLQFCSIKEHRLEEIKKMTTQDSNLEALKSTIFKGWPNERADLPENLRPYFSFKDEMTVQDGVILRGERVVIPSAMRKEMKDKLHAGHLGINSCLRRAREIIFWPNMSAEIRQYIESCDICASFSRKQSEEPLIMHEVPQRPWQKVGIDIYTIENRNYLVTVDYYSQFFEVDYLQEIDSTTVISKIKQHFARYGIPDKTVSDNGPQFSSQEFKKFVSEWGFEHKTSSPGNSKSNGAAEAAVKIAKTMMKKCKKAKEDPYLGLLNLRNTPQEGLSMSPAQRLLGRRTKTLIPTTTEVLKPQGENTEKCRKQMENKKVATAERHMYRPQLKPFNVGDVVRMQPINRAEKEWKEATVSKQLEARSYEVMDERGHTYRRNRQHLRHSTASRKIDITPEKSVNSEMTNEDLNKSIATQNKSSDTENIKVSSPKNNTQNEPYKTKSGRIVKQPVRLTI